MVQAKPDFFYMFVSCHCRCHLPHACSLPSPFRTPRSICHHVCHACPHTSSRICRDVPRTPSQSFCTQSSHVLGTWAGIVFCGASSTNRKRNKKEKTSEKNEHEQNGYKLSTENKHTRKMLTLWCSFICLRSSLSQSSSSSSQSSSSPALNGVSA